MLERAKRLKRGLFEGSGDGLNLIHGGVGIGFGVGVVMGLALLALADFALVFGALVAVEAEGAGLCARTRRAGRRLGWRLFCGGRHGCWCKEAQFYCAMSRSIGSWRASNAGAVTAVRLV